MSYCMAGKRETTKLVERVHEARTMTSNVSEDKEKANEKRKERYRTLVFSGSGEEVMKR